MLYCQQRCVNQHNGFCSLNRSCGYNSFGSNCAYHWQGLSFYPSQQLCDPYTAYDPTSSTIFFTNLNTTQINS